MNKAFSLLKKKKKKHVIYKLYKMDFRDVALRAGTVKRTSDNTLWTLYRSYFKGFTANIELQVKTIIFVIFICTTK
jgi:hypothetical protein